MIKETKPIADQPATRSIEEFCEAARISRSWYFKLSAEILPRHNRFGSKVSILEEPREWHERYHEWQQRDGAHKVAA